MPTTYPNPFQAPMLNLRPVAAGVDIGSDEAAPAPMARLNSTVVGGPTVDAGGQSVAPAQGPVQTPFRNNVAPAPKNKVTVPQEAQRPVTPVDPVIDDKYAEEGTAGATNKELLERRLGTHQSNLFTEAGRLAGEASGLYSSLQLNNLQNQNLALAGQLASTQLAPGYRGGAINPKTGENYDAAFMAAGQKYNIHPGILAAVAQYESNFQDLGPNSSNAIGIMQVVGGPRGVASIDKGASMLGALLYDKKQYPDIPYGDLFSALWAYNAGYTGMKKKYTTGYGGKYQQLIMDAAKNRYGWSGTNTSAASGTQASGPVYSASGPKMPPEQWGPNTAKYAGTNAPNTNAAKNWIMKNWGLTNGQIGTFSTDPDAHVKESQHYYGKAMDVMITGPKAEQVRDWFIANPEAFGTMYVIYQHKRYDFRPGQVGWHPYNKGDHMGHVHISLRPGGGPPVAPGPTAPPFVPVDPGTDPGYKSAEARAKAAKEAAEDFTKRAQLLSRLGGMRIFQGGWR